MARGKFNKRAGGARMDAVSAEEIELRNNRLAEVEEQRAQRRAAEEEADGGGGGDGGGGDDPKASDPKSAAAGGDGRDAGRHKPDAERPPAVVTSEYQHKQNMKKLEEVKKRREVAEAKRKAEQEAEAAAEAARVEAAKAVNNDEGKKKKDKTPKIPKLDKITIKKMKPAQMKEALKVRGLEIQGNAKALTERLLKYEAER